MPLDPEAHVATPSASSKADAGVVVQVPEFSHDNCTPSPLYFNINLPPDQPSNSRVTINITVDLGDRDAPPSYEVAIDRNAPPSFYESLFGQMREARKSCITVYTIFLGVVNGYPLCKMIIGGIYLYDCPQCEYIPVFLLVAGGFHILRNLLQLSGRLSCIKTLIDYFTFVWFIIGSVWVYKEYEPNYDPALGKYCNKTLYLFSFWIATIEYMCLALSTVCVCLGIVFFAFV